MCKGSDSNWSRIQIKSKGPDSDQNWTKFPDPNAIYHIWIHAFAWNCYILYIMINCIHFVVSCRPWGAVVCQPGQSAGGVAAARWPAELLSARPLAGAGGATLLSPRRPGEGAPLSQHSSTQDAAHHSPQGNPIISLHHLFFCSGSATLVAV